ncbi:RepB family plasmid replication initiator protein (plasmid) [Candidatus Methylospira mobilis]|uniref:RepB family plasmid replication initiator protein n=1 Tax=Candidatus Methylospira mobilis TaxID=1808979 RepID=UPI0028E3E13A|nr:RepB family plasmid replication initiator protein [Candidatus Methylospira mobilis]WNV06934.1 RepB family plasmid replication initiator protein [Candidatus Methylospira mobilis]
MPRKDKSKLIVKSNRLIEASYRLNLVEQQIVLFAICLSREEQRGLSPDTPVTISATAFAAQFGTNETKVYGQLKEAIDSLYKRSVIIHDTDPKTGKARVTETRWISDKSYIDGAGQIQITFANRIIPFISRLESEFTSYRLEKIGRMTSAHAVRLYELLVQYVGLGTRELEIAWLKAILQLTDEYPRPDNFKRRVIDVAVSQINVHTDINISYTQRKTGRMVTHLIFMIKSKLDPKAKPPKIDNAYVEKHARPGESYDQALRRLLEERGQTCIF